MNLRMLYLWYDGLSLGSLHDFSLQLLLAVYGLILCIVSIVHLNN